MMKDQTITLVACLNEHVDSILPLFMNSKWISVIGWEQDGSFYADDSYTRIGFTVSRIGDNASKLTVSVAVREEDSLLLVLDIVNTRLKQISPLLGSIYDYHLKEVEMKIVVPLYQIDNDMTRQEKHDILNMKLIPYIDGWELTDSEEYFIGTLYAKPDEDGIDDYCFGMKITSPDELTSPLSQVMKNGEHPMHEYLGFEACVDIVYLYMAEKFHTTHLVIDDSLDEYSDLYWDD